MGFECDKRKLKLFNTRDPFQSKQVILEGYKCRKEGKTGGSLYISFVSNEDSKKSCNQVIYGTPSLSYPYTQTSWKSKNKSNRNLPANSKESVFAHAHKGLMFLTKYEGAKKYYLACKYNGTNILFFKYKDASGVWRVSAKTKGSATVNNTCHGDFLDLTKKALGLTPSDDTSSIDIRNLPAVLQPLSQDNVQSMSCELCGRLEPHLVDYSVDICLKPLFVTLNNGSIRPVIPHTSVSDIKPEKWRNNNPVNLLPDVTGFGPYSFESAEDMVQQCKVLQQLCEQCNEEFRRNHNLKHKYEYFHFATEGFVLYVLGKDDTTVPHRTMYKVKPVDIEEVHWEKFDEQKKAQVKEAIEKLKQRDKEMTIANLREELDIKEKEWGKFGRDILKYVELNRLMKHSTVRQNVTTTN